MSHADTLVLLEGINPETQSNKNMTKKQIELDERFTLTITVENFDAYLDAEYGDLPGKEKARTSASFQSDNIVTLAASFFAGAFSPVNNVVTARDAIVKGAMRVQRLTGGCEILNITFA